MLILLLAGMVTFQTNGFAFRFSPEVVKILNVDFKSTEMKSYRYKTCFLDREQGPSQFGDCTSHPTAAPTGTVLLWGDSHAAALYPGLAARLDPSIQLTQFTMTGCPPVMNIELRKRLHCKELNNYVLDYIARHHPDRVMLVAAWSDFDWKTIEDTISRLRNFQIRHVDLVGPVPVWSSSLPVALFKYTRRLPTSAPLPVIE